MTADVTAGRDAIAQSMRVRNEAAAAFFAREAEPIARLSGQMADRFQRGGRLLAYGVHGAITDAQHVAVEFVHPVLAGKRALPALDLSAAYVDLVPALARRDDIVIGLGPPAGDASVDGTMMRARRSGALCVAFPGSTPDFTMAAPSLDAFVHQEIVEMLYHMLWESVHVYLEHQPVGHASGAATFLYPFLGNQPPLPESLVAEIAASVRAKTATDAQLRNQVVGQSDAICAAVAAIRSRVDGGGTILTFGNGGSATDASDLAYDLATSRNGRSVAPAISLSSDAATITAIMNDVGSDAVFVRQLIAQGRPRDVAFAISTSGGSANIIDALKTARQRGMMTVALLGYDGGDIARQGLADHAIVIHSDQIPRIQEVHAAVYHVIVELLSAAARP